MAGFVDGRPAKLRAACDACSESKVRCSQAKPTCGRCEKNGIQCIYGLSRRSHRSAARVGESYHQVAPPNASSFSNANLSFLSPTLSRLFPSSAGDGTLNGAEAHAGIYADCSFAHPNMLYFRSLDYEGAAAASAAADYVERNSLLFPTGSHLNLPQDQELIGQPRRLSSLSSSSRGFDAGHPNTTASLTTAAELPDESWPWPSIYPDGRRLLSPDKGKDICPSNHRVRCSCASRLVGSLHMLQSAWLGEQPSFDVQLSRLRKATKLSEDCIKCACQSKDELVTVTIGILLFRIIQGFETALALARPDGQGTVLIPRPSRPHSAAPSPPLLWGSMQFDHEEMEHMKQHLWLLQFRKLEKILESLGESVTRMRAAGAQTRGEGDNHDDLQAHISSIGGGSNSLNSIIGGSKGGGGSNSAFVMACECIHMWLNQRARALREKYVAQCSPHVEPAR
ncbi:hypothetical protein GGS23DRAFT_555049 [Durotheca rogersii]|uniref:uncharacterized protein n=1 Tax=Durotheca rogersii TaxID=419775 RepID=UPI00221FE782|nr:uncharacterized protein GGS23DRAFT_555049 [Durotheca rogersii]KAI5866014.1 hypothetical protein GGS23DRAFT_555049 [Durotheca rogersii]